MTMHKALVPRNDIERLHVSRNEDGCKVAIIAECADASIKNHKENLRKTNSLGFWDTNESPNPSEKTKPSVKLYIFLPFRRTREKK